MNVDETTMHPCARCATMQRTCCQRAEILVTQGDVERISRYVGASDFYSRRAPEDPSYLEPDPDDPNWLPYTTFPDGTRNLLLRRADGCTFLGPAGCVLPENVRPLVCRLYPWEFTEAGILAEDAGYCPVETLAGPNGSMLTVLNMTRPDAEQWRADLYTELRANPASKA